jgi:hypothetical protein
MVTINHLKATTFKVDVAMSCILGLFLGNHIQAGSGRAYKWCPFWCQTGSPSTKVTMITRACDYFAKARVAIFFGSQIRGCEGWNITNPKDKMVRHMLQLLQRKAGSGPLHVLPRMPVWEPCPRMFKTGQLEGPTANEAEVAPSATDRQNDAMRNEHTGASPTWWRDSWHGAADKLYNGEINMLLRWTQAINKAKRE